MRLHSTVLIRDNIWCNRLAASVFWQKRNYAHRVQINERSGELIRLSMKLSTLPHFRLSEKESSNGMQDRSIMLLSSIDSRQYQDKDLSLRSIYSRLPPRASCLFYLITLSARASTFGGIVRPICLAAFRLMMNSNFVGCSTGRSAGLAPLRILSTYVAARRSKSVWLTP